ncbi:MAG: DUF4845 domain-containing protein [Gammaproteobacteria bacterium]|nr:MAG: DUF4845 domain-containing protein [Gammaproteobacteria bacterium]
MRKFKQQRGMTMGGLLLVLGLIGFFTMITLKVVPLYIEYGSVAGALDSLRTFPGLGKEGVKAIRNKIDGQFYIDTVETIRAKDVKIERDKKKKVWNVTADYEGRATLFGNMGVWVHFVKTVEVDR